MSTSPRARARPSIDAPSTGSTMPGKSVTMSIRIPYLQVEQALGRADHHPARLQVDLARDLGDRRDQVLTRLVRHDPEVLRRRPLDAGHPPDLPPVLRHHAAPLELPGVEVPRRERQGVVLRQRHEASHERGRGLGGVAPLEGHQDRRALSPHGGNPVLLAPIARRVPQQALPQAPEPFRMVRHRRHADLAGEPVSPRDRADHDEALAHSAFTFARSFRTVFEGWAPLAIHAWTFARSIFTVGGCVIDERIASKRPRSADSAVWSFGAALSVLPKGSIPRIWSSGPSWRTWWSCSRKSSSVNASSRSFRTSSSAFSWSTVCWARSTRESMSPMPRIREASRSGWNGSSASVFSPVPANAIGRPVTERTERAAPPRASPSSFVRITASMPTALLKWSATVTASLPVMASTTSSTWWGPTCLRIATSSSSIASSMWNRPAVSRMRGVNPRVAASSRAWRQISSGVCPAAATTGTSSWAPSVRSCSCAAGRWVSAAASSGCWPCFVYQRASFAAVVVLPEPWSPMSMITVGG